MKLQRNSCTGPSSSHTECGGDTEVLKHHVKPMFDQRSPILRNQINPAGQPRLLFYVIFLTFLLLLLQNILTYGISLYTSLNHVPSVWYRDTQGLWFVSWNSPTLEHTSHHIFCSKPLVLMHSGSHCWCMDLGVAWPFPYILCWHVKIKVTMDVTGWDN